MELVISCPIATDLWQPVDPHNDHKAKVRSDICDVGLPCGGSVCSSETLCCKQVGLLTMRDRISSSKKCSNISNGSLLVVTSGPTGLVQGSTWTWEGVTVHPVDACVHVCGHVYMFVLCVYTHVVPSITCMHNKCAYCVHTPLFTLCTLYVFANLSRLSFCSASPTPSSPSTPSSPLPLPLPLPLLFLSLPLPPCPCHHCHWNLHSCLLYHCYWSPFISGQ